MSKNNNESLERRFGGISSSSLPSHKISGKDRIQKTVYLPRLLAKRLNIAAAEEEREISEVVTDALILYFKSKTSGEK